MAIVLNLQGHSVSLYDGSILGPGESKNTDTDNDYTESLIADHILAVIGPDVPPPPDPEPLKDTIRKIYWSHQQPTFLPQGAIWQELDEDFVHVRTWEMVDGTLLPREDLATLGTQISGDATYHNIALGSDPPFAPPTGHDNTVFGVGAGASYETGAGNVAIGHDALANDVDGVGNTAVGQQALKLHETGNDNTAIGTGVLFNSIDSQANTGIGEQVLFHQQHGNYNVAVGTGCLFNYIGSGAGVSDGEHTGTIANNIAIGHNALHDLDLGYNNVAIGGGAAEDLNGVGVIYNTIVGTNACLAATSGFNNTVIGANAGRSLVAGSRCTILGTSAGYTDGTVSTTDNDGMTLIGYAAQSTTGRALVLGANTGSGYRPNIAIGVSGSTAAFASGSGVIAIAPASTNPSGTPSGCGLLYVDASTSALKYKGPSGTVTQLAVA